MRYLCEKCVRSRNLTLKHAVLHGQFGYLNYDLVLCKDNTEYEHVA